ncbi:MAG: 30S ribosome-binding factor RbfA [Erysipelotrichales bacterium]|nr:30S ribosome-binding factor RbfA [Erysipelotrichales bacterium]
MAMKKEKMDNIIQKELSSILQTEVKDPQIGFCTITDVDVTNDFSIAKVYVSFLGKYTHKNMQALERSKGFIRSILAKRLTIRKCPEIQFVLDTSLEYGNKIEKIIKDINDDKKS